MKMRKRGGHGCHSGSMGGAYLDNHEGYRDDFGADSTVLDEGNSMWPFILKGE